MKYQEEDDDTEWTPVENDDDVALPTGVAKSCTRCGSTEHNAAGHNRLERLAAVGIHGDRAEGYSRNKRALPYRAKTESIRRLPKYELQAGRVHLLVAGEYDRPKTRGECPEERPCPYVGCKWNTFLDVNEDTGSIKYNHAVLEPDEVPAETSCVLDVCDRGGATLEQVGILLNVSRERIRQLENDAIARVKRRNHALLEELEEVGGAEVFEKEPNAPEFATNDGGAKSPDEDDQVDTDDPFRARAMRGFLGDRGAPNLLPPWTQDDQDDLDDWLDRVVLVDPGTGRRWAVRDMPDDQTSEARRRTDQCGSEKPSMRRFDSSSAQAVPVLSPAEAPKSRRLFIAPVSGPASVVEAGAVDVAPVPPPPEPTTPAPAPADDTHSTKGRVMVQERKRGELRDAVLDLLKSGPKTVQEVADDIGTNVPNMRMGLKRMHKNGLVIANDDGTWALSDARPTDRAESKAKATSTKMKAATVAAARTGKPKLKLAAPAADDELSDDVFVAQLRRKSAALRAKADKLDAVIAALIA
jgi:hypothetical protein